MTDFIFTPAEKMLFHRMKTGNYHLIEQLLTAQKVNVNVRGGNVTPMQYLMDFLTPFPQKLNGQSKKNYEKQLQTAAYKMLNEVCIFELLVNHGLDLTTKDRDGHCYLTTVAQKGRLDMIEAFVKAGMPLSSHDIQMARKAAAQNHYTKVEKYLVNLKEFMFGSKKGAKLPETFRALWAAGAVLKGNSAVHLSSHTSKTARVKFWAPKKQTGR